MNKSLLISSLSIVLAAVSTNTLADVKVRGGVASGNYEFKVTSPFGGGIVKSDYTPVTVGLTVIQDNGWYFDGSFATGGGEHDGNDPAPKERFNRTDLALVAGKNFAMSDSGTAGSFFVGLKSGSTTMEYPAGIGDDVFTASGVVIGGGLGFPIAGGSAGFFTANLGVGLMNGKYESPGFSSSTLKADNTVGTSFGLGYIYPISSQLGLAVDYKSNVYKYQFDIVGTNVDVDETINTIGATLTYAM